MSYGSPPRSVGPRRVVTAFALALLAGCGSDVTPISLVVTELSSPAGEGSGEPFLSSSGDTVHMSWLEAASAGGHDLRYAHFSNGGWAEPRTIASSERFFVNWADFPSVTRGPDGALWAHWLERGSQGGYDYGVRIVRSADGGETWSEPRTPHEDGTATEHGFVSTVAVGESLGFLWLDGRRYALADDDGSEPSMEMSLYFRRVDANGFAGPERPIDTRVCDCCQTDMALTSRGPIAVYRDRSGTEIRDIRVARLEEGEWVEGPLVHEDGWETAACPVNGPAADASAERVAVAWFTAAAGVPHVKVAFSDDAAASFGDPIVIDEGNPAGRVDLVMLDDGTAVVAWLERTGGERAEVLVRRVGTRGPVGDYVSVSTSTSQRASGFPRLALADASTLVVAWTDAEEIQSRVRTATIRLERERP